MRKIGACILILLFCFFSYAEDIRSWKSKPKLLTDHYGILNILDLDIGGYQKIPPSFLGKWQCFKSENIAFDYRPLGYTEDCDCFVGDISIQVWSGGNIKHEYHMSRGWPHDLFEEWSQEWSALIKNEPYTCIGGDFVDEERRFKFLMVKPTEHWMFERIKTKRGCSDRIFDCT